jgi:hypothetical protein
MLESLKDTKLTFTDWQEWQNRVIDVFSCVGMASLLSKGRASLWSDMCVRIASLKFRDSLSKDVKLELKYAELINEPITKIWYYIDAKIAEDCETRSVRAHNEIESMQVDASLSPAEVHTRIVRLILECKRGGTFLSQIEINKKLIKLLRHRNAHADTSMELGLRYRTTQEIVKAFEEATVDRSAQLTTSRPQAMKAEQTNKLRCYICKEVGHKANVCPQRKEQESDRKKQGQPQRKVEEDSIRPYANLVTHCEMGRDNSKGWLIDSSASNHMVFDKGMLTDYQDIEATQFKTAEKGGKLIVKGTGTAYITYSGKRIELKNVQYAPRLNTNLISIGALIKEGWNVSFHGNRGWTFNKTRVAMATDASEEDQMNDQGAGMMLWHKKVGHIGYDKMCQLKKQEKIDFEEPEKAFRCMSECDDCIQGKQPRSRGSEAQKQTSQALELVHADVCGPLPKSRDGYEYFLTITDDYTRRIVVR